MAKGRVRSGHVLTCGVAAIANGFMEVLPPCFEALPQRVPPAARRTEDTGLGKLHERAHLELEVAMNARTLSGRLGRDAQQFREAHSSLAVESLLR